MIVLNTLAIFFGGLTAVLLLFLSGRLIEGTPPHHFFVFWQYSPLPKGETSRPVFVYRKTVPELYVWSKERWNSIKKDPHSPSSATWIDPSYEEPFKWRYAYKVLGWYI